MTRTVRAGRRRAFSLIEILIAMAILVLGMLGIMAAFASATKLHKRGIDQTSAALLAETVIGLKQTELTGVDATNKTAEEIGREVSTYDDTKKQYVFDGSDNYPAYQCKVICTPLNEREYRLIVEVRMRPRNVPKKPASDTEQEPENVRFETILLRP